MGWRTSTRMLLLAIVSVAGLIGTAGTAAAADEPSAHPIPKLVSRSLEGTLDWPVSAEDAVKAANRDPEVRRHAKANAPRKLMVLVSSRDEHWEVQYRNLGVEVVRVEVDKDTAERLATWTGHQTIWRMSRGRDGQFGKVLNNPFVWTAFSLVFLLGLLDFRRLSRMVHLDLLVLLSFSLSLAWFNSGEIGVSVPLAYPPLLYLLGRALWLGFGGRGAPLRPSTPTNLLGLAVVFLVVVRIVFNVGTSGVIDVGYAGVIGADHITSGKPIYDNFPNDNIHGDTYGPLNYLAYVPFELIFPWGGEWDLLPAAHALSLLTDLLVVLGLFVLGRRLSSEKPLSLRRWTGWADPRNRLGYLFAFAWVACPFTGYALQSNTNDALLVLPLVWMLVWFTSPVARGALLALGSSIKLAPLALGPLVATGRRGLLAGGWRSLGSPLKVTAAFVVTAAVTVAWVFLDTSPAVLFERTVVNQLDRTSPFSVWGQTNWDAAQTVTKFAVVALGVLVAFLPRRRTLAMIAGLAAAILILQQIALDHWFYLYIPWFLPFLIVAWAAPNRLGPPPRRSRG